MEVITIVTTCIKTSNCVLVVAQQPTFVNDDDPFQTAFLEAAGSGDTARVTELLELVDDINIRNHVRP